MPVEPHDLLHEFPEHRERIHRLKESDSHFRRLFDAYHNMDREIHRIEAAGVNTSDEYVETCKKKRLQLKDELAVLLRKQ